MNDLNERNNLADDPAYLEIKEMMMEYLPKAKAKLVMEGKTPHNVVDADKPSSKKILEEGSVSPLK